MNKSNRYKKATMEIIEQVGCVCEVFTKKNTPQEIEAAYFKALEEGKKAGFMPLLVAATDTLAEYLGILADDGYEKEEVLASSEDGKIFLQNRYNEYADEMEEDYDEDLIGDEEAAEGEILEHFSICEISAHRDEHEVILFRIPVRNPWEIAAWLPMGGWNEFCFDKNLVCFK